MTEFRNEGGAVGDEFISEFCGGKSEVRKCGKNLLWRAPIKRSHREIVVLFVPDSKLLPEVFKRIERVRGIEVLVVFTVTALDLAVVTGRVYLDAFVLDAELFKRFLKQSGANGF